MTRPIHWLHAPALALAAACTAPAVAQSTADSASATTPQETLQPVTVTGNREAGYRAPPASASSKTDIPLLETPMAVQVVPRSVLADQAVLTLKDAVKNVSGVMQAEYDFYDFVQIRGFANGYAANYRNGLQLQGISGLETALVERIEVVKGPASMLYGRIEPGGLVNRVIKAPLAQSMTQASLQLGNFGLRRATLDVTGPIGEGDALSGRAVGATTRQDSFMDFVERRNQVGLLALAWRPHRDFVLNVALEAQNYRFVDTEDIGIPIIGNRPAGVPRNSFYGDPVNRELPNKQNRQLFAADWTWRLGDDWKLTQRLHYDRRDEQQLTIWFNGFDGVSVLDRGLWFVQPERTTFATNLDLQGDVLLGGLRHRVLVGADAFRFRSTWHGFSGTTPEVPPIDIFAPSYGISADALRTLPENFQYADRDEWVGVYAQDQLSLSERWQLLVGGRWDSARTGFGDTGDTIALEKDHAFSPRIGMLYRLDPQTSLYISLSRSFGTNNGRTASGDPLDPQQARQIEIGAKHQSADGSLSVTASIYRLTKTNILTADLSTPAPDDQVAIGEARSQGLELDLLGRVTRQLDLIASYTLTDTRITRNNDGTEGNRLPNVPRHAASLWAKWDGAPGERSGWEAGAGVYARSQRQGDPGNTWQLPGHARVDAMLRWRLPLTDMKAALQVNVENLFDKTYFDRGGSGGAAAKYGSPRAVSATLSVEL